MGKKRPNATPRGLVLFLMLCATVGLRGYTGPMLRGRRGRRGRKKKKEQEEEQENYIYKLPIDRPCGSYINIQPIIVILQCCNTIVS